MPRIIEKLKLEFECTGGGFEEDAVDGTDDRYSYQDSDWMRVVVDSAEVDNSMFCKPVSDQLSLPSCVGNAVANAAEATCVVDLVNRGKSIQDAHAMVPEFSRLFVWWVARNEMFPRAGHIVKGTYIRLAMDCLSRHGIPPEGVWPYDMTKATRRPSIIAFRSAFPWRCDNFYHLRENESKLRVSALIQACRWRQFPCYGTKVDEAFLSHVGDEVLGRPTGKIIGGHAMMLCGYSSERRAFLSLNSWGRSWGKNGFFWISEDWIGDANLVSSIWIPTKGFM